MKTAGRLVVSAGHVGVAGRFELALDDAEISIELPNKFGFPHLVLRSPKDRNKKRMLFPTKCFGLEANSLYSTLRHLAETDPETRNAYSPELIREMLLFTPDRDVAVGESIEVRVVVPPRVPIA